MCVISLDHWHDDPKPTFGLIEAIGVAIDTPETLSYWQDFISILKSMGLKEPKISLANLLPKIKCNTAKAEDWGLDAVEHGNDRSYRTERYCCTRA